MINKSIPRTNSINTKSKNERLEILNKVFEKISNKKMVKEIYEKEYEDIDYILGIKRWGTK